MVVYETKQKMENDIAFCTAVACDCCSIASTDLRNDEYRDRNRSETLGYCAISRSFSLARSVPSGSTGTDDASAPPKSNGERPSEIVSDALTKNKQNKTQKQSCISSVVVAYFRVPSRAPPSDRGTTLRCTTNQTKSIIDVGIEIGDYKQRFL
jgi:hypothetical protein